ncbi:unnamed protein product [Heligmosomoides polygyrus]|uniref:ABC transporter, ATP-binding protein n=1 Tax=Heligmosomoides polygyrus TaxID=6339 RepID=A0A183G103_HELPZ|nr:unnamed protein product [Heligmosomoides polygyrus]
MSCQKQFREHQENTNRFRGDLAEAKVDREPVSVSELFRFASSRDRHFVVAGFLLSVLIGAILPLNCVFAGYYANFYLLDSDVSKQYFLSIASRSISGRIRKEFVKAVLRQHAAWFEENSAGSITTKLNENVAQIEDGIGDKIGMLARGVSVFISSAAFAFAYNWRITLICVAVGPVSAITMAIMSRLSSSSMQGMMSVASAAGAIAEEAIMNAKTVAACNGQKQIVKKYEEELKNAKHFAIRYSFINGFFEGFMYFQLYVFYAAAILYGITSYYHGVTTEPGTIFISASAVLLGSYFFGLLGPHMMAIMKARIAAAIIYETIDLAAQRVSNEPKGQEMSTCQGRLVFRDVHFKYPSRDAPILRGVSWVAEPGETIAFVGQSGCGKSTSIALLTKLYDCDSGETLLDGQDIRSISTSDIRKLIGIVQQEPCLFNGTIRENIMLGRPISDEQAVEAARIAHAHDFIMKLEKGYETVIGTGGIALSGGQKQRLAIARAIATQPKILLLDEATSALDSESEKIVQLALNRASLGRTTVVIAHRLSTLKDVQRIYVIKDGRVSEEIMLGGISGTHFELLEKHGLYSHLAAAQEVGVDLGGRKRSLSESIDQHAQPMPLARHSLRGSGMTRRSISSGVPQQLEQLYKEKAATIMIGFGGWSGETVTSRMRVKVLRSLLSQEAEFFDRPLCSNAACVSELAAKAPDVQACLDYRFMLMVNNLCAVAVCVVLSIVTCWAGGVAMTVLITLFTICMWITSNRISANMDKKSEIDKTPELAIEIFEHAKTIQLLAVEPYFMAKYENYGTAVAKQERWIVIFQSIQFALTQCYIYFSDMVMYGIGAAMIYGGYTEAVNTVV